MDEEIKNETQSAETQAETQGNQPETEQTNPEGRIKISEDVIAQLALKALGSVEGVSPANPGLMANLRIGRKTVNGVRINITEGDIPEISVDAYIAVKYGLRIPDVCWDVQEAIKGQIERFTGYTIKGVNVYVQGISFDDGKAKQQEETSGAGEAAQQQFGGDAQ